MNDTTWWARLNNRALELIIGLGLLLVAFADVLIPLVAIAGPASGSHDVRAVHVRATTEIPDAAASGFDRGPVSVSGTDHAVLNIADPDLIERVLLLLPTLTRGVLVVVMLLAVLHLAQTFQVRDFFAARNTRRLRVIAVTLFLIGAVVPALDVITTHLLVSGHDVQSTVWTPYDLKVGVVFLALLVGGASEAFRRGTRLHADTEGLV
ncbi:DUF2975 domain-containing protein [Streptomyces sp. NPDC051776]|uniref:DUF2975 domain-containing protein n=1 Tax=Streptomyces sp. NPDC051776 TaxID=3155414 RepID=UPI0034366AF2